MFAPDLPSDASPERRRHPRRLDYFAHGEITRRVLEMLRVGGTIQAIDVAKQAMEEKGLSFEDRPVRTEFYRRITMQLNHMRRQRKVEKIGEGAPNRQAVEHEERVIAGAPEMAVAGATLLFAVGRAFAVPRQMFAEILSLIGWLQAPPAPA
jgi:hypothetical protein